MPRIPLRFAKSPPAITIGTIMLILGAQRLVALGSFDGSPASARFVNTVEWVTWVFLAGFSVAVFVVLFGFGIDLVLRPAPQWGLAALPKS